MMIEVQRINELRYMFNEQNIAIFRNSLKPDSGYQRVAWSRYAPDRRRGGVENPSDPAKSNRAPSLLYARAELRKIKKHA